MLQVLIVSRLNLALVLLKSKSSKDAYLAAKQAEMGLQALAPFCVAPCEVRRGKDPGISESVKEPKETYVEACKLQAKAYFRLGSAQTLLKHHKKAVQSFERSLKSTQKAEAKPDRVVEKRLLEAKRKAKQQERNAGKRFRAALREEVLQH